MLTNTFCHIPGIGETTERRLWSAGVTSWDAALDPSSGRGRHPVRPSWAGDIRESISRYSDRDYDYFAGMLPPSQEWRIYRDLQDRCAFVDIETTGLYYPIDITTAVLYDGRTIRHFVNGQNLGDFVRAIQDYELLVTYNGKTFDIPVIQGYFRTKLPRLHIDLRYPLRSLGLTGGLKGCEQKVGLTRPGLEEVDGYVAALLWNEYRKHGNAKVLETLLAYNAHDTVSLHALMVHAYNEKVKATPFAASHLLPTPAPAELPFRPDPDTVARVIRQRF
jgi:uncharacterized protein YprB with RNaseH-like and TPR domain